MKKTIVAISCFVTLVIHPMSSYAVDVDTTTQSLADPFMILGAAGVVGTGLAFLLHNSSSGPSGSGASSGSDSSFSSRAMPCNPQPNSKCNAVCIQHLQDIVDNYRQSIGIPGMQMSISFPDQSMQNYCSGRTLKNGGTPINQNNLFEIGSDTKSFTAALILQLEAEGKLDLNDTLGKWFPGEYLAWQDTTIDQLLHMTSPLYTLDTLQVVQRLFANPTYQWSDTELMNWAYQLGPNCSVDAQDPFCPAIPGQGWSYSDTNYMLLGIIAAKATGKTVTELMYDHLFKPLGLAQTIYDPKINPANIPNMAHGYSDDPQDPYYNQDVTGQTTWISFANTSGGIISTSENMAAWIRALFSGKVLPVKQFAKMTSAVCMVTDPVSGSCVAGQPMPANYYGLGYGCGVIKNVTPNGTIWMHQGDIEGYQAGFIYDVNSDIVIAGTRSLTHLLTDNIPGEEDITEFMGEKVLPYLKQQK